MKRRTKRQKAIIRRRIFLTFCSVILIATIALISFLVSLVIKPNDKQDITSSNISSTVSQEKIPDTYATVLSIGDIMAHSTQLKGAKTTDGYDFSAFFKEISPYFQKSDLNIGNLELTFGGKESGSYRGYPTFNTPDQLATDIKNSGINLLMTANNHSYDTGAFGLTRTPSVLEENGIEYTGTKKNNDQAKYIIKEINNIKIGIANYTYETQTIKEGRKYLNGILVSEDCENLINSFSYQNIDEFYTEAQQVIENMKQDGAEYISFYMHWGEEYQLTANTWQKSIAQKLSNMGVNMIVGGHPHVVQPMELIHSEDGQNTTICIYSLGNAVSNQRRELISNSRKGHTEDGVIFSYTLRKTSDGTVSLDDVDIIPTWVYKYNDNGFKYTIYPIENLDDATEKYPNIASKLKESYNRTKETVAKTLTECQQEIGCDITFKE